MMTPLPPDGAPEAATRTCPAPGCNTRINPGLFACSSHWFEIPGPVRTEIWRAWRHLMSPGRRRRRDLDSDRAALDRYREASRKGLEALGVEEVRS